MDVIRIEGTDLTMSGVLPPEGFWLSKNPKETIMKNIRAVLQAFGTKVNLAGCLRGTKPLF